MKKGIFPFAGLLILSVWVASPAIAGDRYYRGDSAFVAVDHFVDNYFVGLRLGYSDAPRYARYGGGSYYTGAPRPGYVYRDGYRQGYRDGSYDDHKRGSKYKRGRGHRISNGRGHGPYVGHGDRHYYGSGRDYRSRCR